MRALLLGLLVATVGLSGCTDDGDGGGFFDFITGGASLDGECGHVYNEDRVRQIIISVEWTKQTLGKVNPRDVEVSATYFGDKAEASSRDARPYDERHVDSKGCIGFEVMEPGGYSFWAFAESDTPNCFVDGRLDGTFNGEEIVGGTLVMDRYFGGEHC